MGWNSIIQADRCVEAADIDAAVDAVPDDIRIGVGIYPGNNIVVCGGSFSLSGHVAERFTGALCANLVARGYAATAEMMW